MEARVNYILVGIFVLALGTAFVFAVLWLTTGGFYRESDRYLIYFTDSVSGLNPDAVVEYQGVSVGRVARLRIDPDNPERVEVLIEVERRTPVKTDTVATLELQGLTGLRRVNLTGGTREAPLLVREPDEPYPVIPSEPSLFDRLEEMVSGILEALERTAGRLNRFLSAENEAAVAQILADLQAVTGTLAGEQEAIVGAIGDLARMLENTREASATMPELVEQFSATARTFEQMASDLAAAGASVRTHVEASGADLSRFTGEALPEAGALVGELRRVAENLRQFSEELERDPSALLFGTPRPTPGPGE